MPFLLKIECNGRHQLEAYLESSAAVFELVWNWSSCPIHSRSLMYFLQGWQYSVRFPHTSCARIHMIVRTQRTISEITFQMWDISIPDVGYIHTWCSRRSTAGSSNSQYWHASILCGHCMLVWRSHSSRSIVHLHSEQFIYIHNKISIVDA